VGGNNELPHTERGLIYESSGFCSYGLVSSHSNVVRGFLVIASITPAATKEIFETVEISKFSICRSCSCVKLPSRGLNLINCVRAMSLASLRVALVSSVALTPGLSSFLATRLSFQVSLARKIIQIGKRLKWWTPFRPLKRPPLRAQPFSNSVLTLKNVCSSS
jgi:hypothetical protein